MRRISKFNPHDWYVFCDICGKRCHASETTKLHTDTGRGGLIVCRQDADKADLGLIPFNVRKEFPVPFSRRDPNNTSNDYPVFDLETNNVGDLTFYTFLATSQGTNEFIELSQDGILLQYSEEIDTASTVEEYSSYTYISTSQGLNEVLIPSQYDEVLLAESQEK